MKANVTAGSYFIKESDGKQRKSYCVDGYTAQGKRVRRRFKSIEAAQGHIHRLEMADLRRPSRYSTQETHLTTSRLREAEKCFDMLPEKVTLTEALESFLRTFDPSVKLKPARDALTEFLGMKESENCRPLTLDNLRRRLTKFVADLDNPVVAEISEADARTFLDDFTPTNSNNYRRAVGQFLDFCVHRGYAPTNVLHRVKTKKFDRVDEIMILTVEQSRRLLKGAHNLHGGTMLPYVALALFAGLRPISEIESLAWRDIDLAGKEIHVKRTKNRNHVRFVGIHRTLFAWLRLCEGKPIMTANHRRKLAALKQTIGFKGALPGERQKKIDANLKRWEADILRHTYGSYLFAEKKDVALVATQMGNSVDMVMRHYRKAVRPTDAATFWRLTPNRVLNPSSKRKASSD